MGTGKTTIGRLLAERLGFGFVDTDAIIEEQHGPIHVIFAEQGEAAFRTIEQRVAVELADRHSLVIATGGRMMLDPTNVAALCRRGRIFCLVTSAADILERVTADSSRVERPLLAVDDPAQRIADLLDERAPFYRQFAQLSTHGHSPSAIADELAEWATVAPLEALIGADASGSDETGFDAVVGPAVFPLIREYAGAEAGVDGPLIIVTDEPSTSLVLAQCPTPDHLFTLSTAEDQNLDDAQSRGRVISAELRAAGVDASALVVSLGGRSACEIAAFVANDLPSSTVVHCPTDASLIPDGTTRPPLVVLDVAVLQSEATHGDLRGLVSQAMLHLEHR